MQYYRPKQKKIVQHRNNLLPYYPNEYALCELIQLYSFTGLKIIQNNSNHEKKNQSADMNSIQKPLEKNKKGLKKQISKNLENKKKTQTERKKRKLEEKFLLKDQKEKPPHRQSSRLRNQPRKDYKTFIPQPKILKKVEFKPL